MTGTPIVVLQRLLEPKAQPAPLFLIAAGVLETDIWDFVSRYGERDT
jgi:hypothetical protein